MVDMIQVRSATGITISLFSRTIPLKKVWAKRGAIVNIERDKLVQAFFETNLPILLRQGKLIIEDKKFLYEVGFLVSEDEDIGVIELTPNLMKRCISVMPIHELAETLKKLSRDQIKELAEFAVENNGDLKMDRIDLLTKASGKNILKAIEQHKADQEG